MVDAVTTDVQKQGVGGHGVQLHQIILRANNGDIAVVTEVLMKTLDLIKVR